MRKGHKKTDADRQKHSEAMQKLMADPARRERFAEQMRETTRKRFADPVKRAEQAERGRQQMLRNHADPEWQARRDAKAAETMTNNWLKYRDKWKADAALRYARHAAEATGLCSALAIENKKAAHRWIYTQAQQALRTETDFLAVRAAELVRLRGEHPYSGPDTALYYQEYLSNLCKMLTASPVIRNLVDPFMREAIPRFAAEWNARGSRP